MKIKILIENKFFKAYRIEENSEETLMCAGAINMLLMFLSSYIWHSWILKDDKNEKLTIEFEKS